MSQLSPVAAATVSTNPEPQKTDFSGGQIPNGSDHSSQPSPSLSRSPVSQPISAGVINGRAITLPTPIYPPNGKAAHVFGKVEVEVLIDETGAVISARALSGHQLLRVGAEEAARSAKFSPTTLLGNQ